jgi:uncharacterized protein
MANEPKDGLNRRDFVMAAIALVGAPTALVNNAGAAGAQRTKAPDAPQGTIYTGDVIQGKKVISALDVNDLESGKKHAFYFQGVQMPMGQHWYVSVMVARGANPGKRIALISGIHGDEISSVYTVQTVMSRLDPAQMSGTVLAVTDVSRPALEGMQRRWPNSGRGIDLIDMNREWPGNENGASAPSRHAGLLFNRLFRPNADYAIDFHTARDGDGFDGVASCQNGPARGQAIAELFPIDQIFDNAGYPGILANAFIDAGIPAFTPEIGAPRILDHVMIPRFVEGTMNVLKRHGVIAGPMGRIGRDSGVFVANSGHTVLATHGGFVELLVKLSDKVDVGQNVAIQRDTFGEIVAEYTSGVTGEVVGRRTDATAEPGTPLVFIFYNNTPSENPVDYVE